MFNKPFGFYVAVLMLVGVGYCAMVPKSERAPTNQGANSTASSPDARQAREFLSGLPSACSSSSMSTSSDGSVTIYVRCNDDANSMNGKVKIHNGVVTEIQ